MRAPATNDTIVAVASAWEASPVAIVRLSGPEAEALVAELGVDVPPGRRPLATDALLTVDATLRVPATMLWFRAPRSYTGQDLVELHTVGCLPVLRELCDVLIARGARRAMPGEFTARAFIAGRLRDEDVRRVMALLAAQSTAAVRAAARAGRTSWSTAATRWRAQLVELLARVEAGIDFVDEEDVRFINGAELGAAIGQLRAELAAYDAASAAAGSARHPVVALVGRPNAGKSTLLNALAGHARAIVSPVVGTTRDVLSVDVQIGGLTVTVQDCAGLGESTDELELMTHRATERAADQADVVLWVHPAGAAWTPRERAILARVPAERRLVVLSKTDLADALPGAPDAGLAGVACVAVCAPRADGLATLRTRVAECLAEVGAGRAAEGGGPVAAAALAALARAEGLVAAGGAERTPELVALELRSAIGHLLAEAAGDTQEAVLGEIYARFCVGK